MLDILNNGGPVVWVLMGMSVVALAVSLFKLLQYRLLGVYGGGAHRATRGAIDYWQAGDAAAARKQLQPHATQALPDMVLTAMDGVLDPQIEEKEAREAAARVGADAMERLRSGFRTLEFVATAAPLLGLLGTVLGMIEAFEALKAAGNQVEVSLLSGGISEALLTTAAGLVVALPTVFFLSILERRLEHFHHRLQSATTQVFTVKADQLRDRRLTA